MEENAIVTHSEWAQELRQALAGLTRGASPRVGFADREDLVGELGREFNALSAELQHTQGDSLSRERAHRLRNRLAGLLAALHVLKESAGQPAVCEEAIALARELDARLRGR